MAWSALHHNELPCTTSAAGVENQLGPCGVRGVGSAGHPADPYDSNELCPLQLASTVNRPATLPESAALPSSDAP